MSASSLDRAVSIAVAVAAVAIAAAVVKRSFFPVPAPLASETVAERAAPMIDTWRDALEHGITIAGDSLAAVTIVEFSDFECPACRGFHEVLRDVSGRRSRELRIVYVAYPLPSHRFAMPAARGMECADSLGRASQWADAIYRSQDSLGLLGWGEFARRAGIPDTARIVQCATRRASFRRIDAGLALAEEHGITATPTFWVNGLQFRGGLPEARLDSLVMRLAASARD
jgi:protein-disulfide isomerase